MPPSLLHKLCFGTFLILCLVCGLVLCEGVDGSILTQVNKYAFLKYYAIFLMYKTPLINDEWGHV